MANSINALPQQIRDHLSASNLTGLDVKGFANFRYEISKPIFQPGEDTQSIRQELHDFTHEISMALGEMTGVDFSFINKACRVENGRLIVKVFAVNYKPENTGKPATPRSNSKNESLLDFNSRIVSMITAKYGEPLGYALAQTLDGARMLKEQEDQLAQIMNTFSVDAEKARRMMALLNEVEQGTIQGEIVPEVAENTRKASNGKKQLVTA